MPNVIDFLERLGQDSNLRYAQRAVRAIREVARVLKDRAGCVAALRDQGGPQMFVLRAIFN